VACIALLADKDAGGVVRAIAPRLDLAVCTELPADMLAHAGRPAARSLDASSLAETAAGAGLPTAVVPDPSAAIRQAVSEARDRRGAALICGSHYLLRYAVQAPA
jgi:folylpolyglutamate synthase/dihydropteroate synthase